jgi:archaellum component FlaC
MATRMQQRRGTAAQWTAANPVLGAGEIGFETDTGKFKIGDGTNQWEGLAYFLTLDELGGSLDDYVPLTFMGEADGVATLDENGKIPVSQLGNIIDGAPEVLDTLNEIANAIAADENFFERVIATEEAITNLNENVESLDGTLEGVAETVNGLSQDVSDLSTAQGNLLTEVGDIQEALTTAQGVIEDLQGETSALEESVGNLETNKADLDSPTFTGTVVLPGTTSIGDVSSTELGYLNGVTSDIQTQLNGKLESSTASSTYAPLSGPTFTGTVVLPNTTSIGNVSDTEIGYLDGVTSAIQTQLNSKAPTANPTFTGTVSGVTKSHVGLGNVDNTADADKSVSTATQTALDLKSPKADPTFTGTVVLPSTTSIGEVSSTELGYVNGVTSAIQTQLDSKLNLSGGTMTGRVTLSADPTQALHAVTKQYVDGIEAGLKAKPAVLAATSTNVAGTYNNGTNGVGATLTAASNGSINTVAPSGVSTWAIGSGILLKNQTNKAHNGRYFVTDLGSASTPYVLTRCGLCDEASEIPGAYVFVQDGVHQGTGWVQIVADPSTFVVGTDNIDVFQFSGPGAITGGTGITVSGNEVSISTGAITSTLIADGTIMNGDINSVADIDQSKIKNLASDLIAKAPTASPTFTGLVTVASNGIAFSDGTQTKQGVPSITSISAKTDSYTLSNLNERDTIVEINKSTAVTLTIPTNSSVAYPVGTTLDIIQTGAGQVTIAGAGGVTVNGTPGLKLRTQWSSATLLKRAENTWLVYGDLTA